VAYGLHRRTHARTAFPASSGIASRVESSTRLPKVPVPAMERSPACPPTDLVDFLRLPALLAKTLEPDLQFCVKEGSRESLQALTSKHYHSLLSRREWIKTLICGDHSQHFDAETRKDLPEYCNDCKRAYAQAPVDADSVVLKHTDEKGIGAYAAQPLNAGSKILVEAPLAASPQSHCRSSLCWECMHQIGTEGCSTSFCSIHCSKLFMEKGRWLSTGLASSLNAELITALQMATAPRMQQQPWRDLQRHWESRDLVSLMQMASDAAVAAAFFHISCPKTAVDHRVLPMIVLDALNVLRSNSFTVNATAEASTTSQAKLTELAHVGRGVAIYAGASRINHSCNPNAVAAFDGCCISIVLTCEVSAGEEICISYGPDAWRDPYQQRQRHLSSCYCFSCECDSCKLQQSSHVLGGDARRSASALWRKLEKVNLPSVEDLAELESLVEELRRRHEPHNFELARGIDLLARYSMTLGGYERAVSLCEESISILGRKLRPFDPALGREHDKLASLYFHLQKWDVSFQHALRALNILIVTTPMTSAIVRDLVRLLHSAQQEACTCPSA
jgi:hypothetical protein